MQLSRFAKFTFRFISCSYQIQIVFTSCSYQVHFMFISDSNHVHIRFTSCSHNFHIMSISCSHHVHIMFRSDSCHFHIRFISCSDQIHILFISDSYHVHIIFTSCSCLFISISLQGLPTTEVLSIAMCPTGLFDSTRIESLGLGIQLDSLVLDLRPTETWIKRFLSKLHFVTLSF